MSVQFKGNSLVDERGNEWLISYEQLRQACLEGPYKSISVKEIIFDAVTRLTREKVVGVYYRQSKLFCNLEREIVTDEAYQKRKAEVLQQRAAYKKPEKPNVYMLSANAQRAAINKLRKQMKR